MFTDKTVMTNPCFICVHPWPNCRSFQSWKWQQHGKAGASGFAVEFYCAVMLADVVLRQRQAESMAIGTPRYQRIKNLVLQSRRDARAIVDDLHHHRQTVAALDQRDLPRDAGTQDEIG